MTHTRSGSESVELHEWEWTPTPDLPAFKHDISNVVLYLESEDGTIFKVKVEDFPEGKYGIRDLDDVPLEELLALFPEGDYTFTGTTVDGIPLVSKATLTHAIPSGPRASARITDDSVTIRWQPQASPPQGFPDRQVQIVGYQVIVGSFQVTLPASARTLTLPREFVRSLGRGRHAFEVLAVEKSGNQTITEGSFVLGAGEDR